MRSINFFLFCLNTGDNAGAYWNGASVLVPSDSFIQLEGCLRSWLHLSAASYNIVCLWKIMIRTQQWDWPMPYQFDSDLPLPVRAHLL